MSSMLFISTFVPAVLNICSTCLDLLLYELIIFAPSGLIFYSVSKSYLSLEIAYIMQSALFSFAICTR